MLATHKDRERLFREAGRTVVDLCERWYGRDDATALPRGIATRAAFETAMSLDVAMGGSTNTVLHLLAAAHEAQVDFAMADIDRISRRTPVLCKVAPSKADVHMEDVHRRRRRHGHPGRAQPGGADRRRHPPPSTAPTLADALARWDVAVTQSADVLSFYSAAPGGVPTQTAFSQERRWDAAGGGPRRRRGARRGPRLLPPTAAWRC